ncbi:hypothetical protein KW785_02365 [Candidatus Parcubacteria bacterium]|nr:hypothetical protein [Candidatus Parcubacteria bacterium]
MKKENNKSKLTFKDFGFANDELSEEELGNVLERIFKGSGKPSKKDRNTKIIGWIAVASLIIGIFIPNESIGGVLCGIGFVLILVWIFKSGYIKYSR